MKKLLAVLLSVLIITLPISAGRHFDEVDDDIQVSDSADLTFPDATDWTVAGWFRLDDNTGGDFQYFLSWGGAGDVNTFNCFVRETGTGTDPNKLSCDIRDIFGNPLILTSSTTPGTSTNWQFFLLDFDDDASPKKLTMYIDSVEVATDTSTGYSEVNRTSNWFFGSRSDGNVDRFFGGDLANWARWDRSMTPGERLALSKGLSPAMIPGATWFYPFWGAGSPEPDLAGAIVDNGTVTGATASDHCPCRSYKP